MIQWMTFLDDPDASPACLGVPTEAFFPGKGESVAAAKRVCARCDLRPACKEWALAQPQTELYGVFGGTSPGDRKRIREARRRQQQTATRTEAAA